MYFEIDAHYDPSRIMLLLTEDEAINILKRKGGEDYIRDTFAPLLEEYKVSLM
jgi:hypothetical protein